MYNKTKTLKLVYIGYTQTLKNFLWRILTEIILAFDGRFVVTPWQNLLRESLLR